MRSRDVEFLSLLRLEQGMRIARAITKQEADAWDMVLVAKRHLVPVPSSATVRVQAPK